jgi:protein-S-isoprenylcysteine O-methyltransferase Ste14
LSYKTVALLRRTDGVATTLVSYQDIDSGIVATPKPVSGAGLLAPVKGFSLASLMFRYRGLVGGLLLFPAGVVALIGPPILHGTAVELIGSAMGWLLFIGYLMLRLWATMYIGGRKDKHLQTAGPYSITRNPLYLGSLAYGLSIIFFLHSLTLLAAFLLVTLIYSHWVIKSEEEVLEGKFGDEFRAYCARVPRLFPSFTNYHTDDSVLVNVPAMKMEAKRLSRAALLPITLQMIICLRIASVWPQWFTSP